MINFNEGIAQITEKSDVAKELYDILIKIWDNPEFVFGTLKFLPDEQQKRKLIDYIQKYNVTNSDDVCVITLCILDNIEPELKSSDDD